jgi:curved DNA-binding protein CbpA
MNENDLYKILNIQPSASNIEIKEQFKKLSLKYHPDKSRLSENSEEIKKKYELISLAYSILSKKDTRREYDQMYYIEQRTEDHNSMKSKFKEFTPTIPSKDEHESIILKRHEDLINNFSDRNKKDYLKQREEQDNLKPIKESEKKKSNSVIKYDKPEAIIPSKIDNLQEIDKVGEMYDTNKKLDYDNFDINIIDEEDFKEEDVKLNVNKHKGHRTELLNLDKMDYKTDGDLILDKIILH